MCANKKAGASIHFHQSEKTQKYILHYRKAAYYKAPHSATP